MNPSMETTKKPNQGIGYLIGSAVSIAMAIIVFAISENVTVAISAAIPTGTAIGIALEQKFQGKTAFSKNQKNYLIGILVLGIGVLGLVIL